ncbi:MAG TPA: acetolactate synthase [Verrucomicrobiales bacterium]|nr:acetolactate synthase [Verrucomicrobiales bacterium]
MSEVAVDRNRREPVRQFSVFTENRMGRLHDLIELFNKENVHVLALTALDTTDAAILRTIVDDPDRARQLLVQHSFPFTESEVLVVEVDSENRLKGVLSALLEAEVNIHYVYSFITRPTGRSALALSLEDIDVATAALRQHQFRVLYHPDIVR